MGYLVLFLQKWEIVETHEESGYVMGNVLIKDLMNNICKL